VDEHERMRRRWTLIVVSAASGLAWGGLVMFLLLPWYPAAMLVAGLLASPLIGMCAGRWATLFKDADATEMAIVCLVALYATSILYGFSTVVLVSFTDLRHPAPNLTNVVLFPLAMTTGGYVLWMWPLSYLNHRLIGRLA
jgi:LytS/YehU family sensor histidine kinase